MAETGSILIVDDDEDILAAGRLLLRRQFGEVLTCRRPERIPELLAEHDVDAVLLDMNFGPGESSGAQGLDWLARILAIDPQLVVVMITAHGSVDTVVEAMKRGATDFVAKPWQNEKLVATMSAAVKLRASRRENESLKQANRVLADAATPGSPIVGRSRPMRDLMSVVRRAAPTDANVLILGENGTGKELVARELHRLSQRADAVFLGVDVGAVHGVPVRVGTLRASQGRIHRRNRNSHRPLPGGARRHAVPRRDRQPGAGHCRRSCCACWRRAS